MFALRICKKTRLLYFDPLDRTNNKQSDCYLTNNGSDLIIRLKPNKSDAKYSCYYLWEWKVSRTNGCLLFIQRIIRLYLKSNKGTKRGCKEHIPKSSKFKEVSSWSHRSNRGSSKNTLQNPQNQPHRSARSPRKILHLPQLKRNLQSSKSNRGNYPFSRNSVNKIKAVDKIAIEKNQGTQNPPKKPKREIGIRNWIDFGITKKLMGYNTNPEMGLEKGDKQRICLDWRRRRRRRGKRDLHICMVTYRSLEVRELTLD